MHLGSPDPTEGPCFTIKDYMHRDRHVTYTIMLIGTITGHKSKYVVIKYVVIIVYIYNCIVSEF
jgi:hypothetical protein